MLTLDIDPSIISEKWSAFDTTYINDVMPYFSLLGDNGGAVFVDNLKIEVIPEPASLLLLGLGGLLIRRK
jgi:hypothetical protein